MTDDYLQKQARQLTRVMLTYLSVQAALLAATYLDSPIYVQTYLASGDLPVTPWLGLWFLLAIFGLITGLLLLAGPAWRRVLDEAARVKLAAGYLLGALAGLLTLGLRFMPVMPPEYFLVLAGLLLLGGVGYAIWRRRQPRLDEIFP